MNYKYLIVIILSFTLLAIAAIVGSSFLYTSQQVESATGDEISMTGHMWSSNTGWISLDSDNNNNSPPPNAKDYQLIMQMQENGDGVYIAGSVSSTNDPGRYGWAGRDYLGWLDFSPDNSNNGNLQQTNPPGGDFRYTSGGGDQEGYFEGSAQFVAGKEDNDGWDGWLKFDGSDYQVKRDYCDFTGHAWGDMSVGWVSVNEDQSSGYYDGGYNPEYRMGFAEDDVTSCEKPEIDVDTVKLNGRKMNDPKDLCGDGWNKPGDDCVIDNEQDVTLSWEHENGVDPTDIANITIKTVDANTGDPIEVQGDPGANPITKYQDHSNPDKEFQTNGDELSYTFKSSELPDMGSTNDNIGYEITTTNKFGDTDTLETLSESSVPDFTINEELSVTCEIVERRDEAVGTVYHSVASGNDEITTDINNLFDIRITLGNAFAQDIYRLKDGEIEANSGSVDMTYDGEGDYQDEVDSIDNDNKTGGLSGDNMSLYHYHTNFSPSKPDGDPQGSDVFDVNYEGTTESNSLIFHNVRVGDEVDPDTISDYIGELDIRVTVENSMDTTHVNSASCPDVVNFGQRNFRESN